MPAASAVHHTVQGRERRDNWRQVPIRHTGSTPGRLTEQVRRPQYIHATSYDVLKADYEAEEEENVTEKVDLMDYITGNGDSKKNHVKTRDKN